VVDAGPPDLRAESLGSRVVQGEGQALNLAHLRLDLDEGQACGDAVVPHADQVAEEFVAELGVASAGRALRPADDLEGKAGGAADWRRAGAVPTDSRRDELAPAELSLTLGKLPVGPPGWI
jgi:hypothetical protein